MTAPSDQPEPNRPHVLNVAAKALQAGDFDKAAAVLRPLLEKHPDDATAWRLLGLARFGASEHLEGMNQVRRAIALEPNNAAPHRDLGAVFIQMERYTEAVDAYRSALALDRHSAEAWNGFGAAVWRMEGGLDEAIAAFRTATALKGDYAEAYNNLGTSLRDRGDFTEAIVACRQALNLKRPASITAHNLAMALLSAGRWEEAWPLFEDRLKVPGCISKSVGDVNLNWDGTPMPEGRLLVVFEQGIGDTIQFVRTVGPKGRVLAFEPQRLIFQMLCGNVACNGLWHVDCCQAAVGSQPGRIQVPQLNPTVRQNFGGLGLDKPQRGEGAAVITIDGLNLPRCHFIKIDVEGMEANVLEGARKTIRTHKPILYVEHDRQHEKSPVTALLRDLNYTLYMHRPPLFNPQNFARHDINVFGPVRSQNLLCVHQSRDQRIEGLLRVEG